MNHKAGKMEEAESTVKHTIDVGSAVGAGLHSLLRRGEMPTAKTRPERGPVGPWPDLRAAAPAADPGEKSFDGDQ